MPSSRHPQKKHSTKPEAADPDQLQTATHQHPDTISKETKTIEIDEVITADGAPPAPDGHSSGSATPPPSANNPFAEFESSLPWKARWTLRFTRWFMLLRSKPWGKLVIIPAVILATLLAIPLGILFFCFLVIRSFLRSFRN